MKGVCLIKCIVTLIKLSLNITVGFDKVTALSMPSSCGRKIEKNLGSSGVGRMLLTDLSKAFDCLRHDLLIAKLAACGFDQPSLCCIFSYLSGRKHRGLK